MTVSLKTLFVLGAFVVVAIVVLYLFTLLTGEEKPVGENEQVQIVQAPEAETQPATQVDESAKFYPPDEVLASLCSQYSDLPADVVLCRKAYDFVIKTYKASIDSFGLFLLTSDGSLQRFTAEAVTSEGARLVWYAVLEEGSAFKSIGPNASQPPIKVVLLDARDLSVVKETP